MQDGQWNWLPDRISFLLVGGLHSNARGAARPLAAVEKLGSIVSGLT